MEKSANFAVETTAKTTTEHGGTPEETVDRISKILESLPDDKLRHVYAFILGLTIK